MIEYFDNTKEFTKSAIPHRIYTSDKQFMIDLIPFGEVEEAHYVIFKDRERTKISTFGLKEVFESSVKVIIDNDFEILSSSLHGLIILKLISWSDRPEVRLKDLTDIAFILMNYFNLQDDLIYEKHNDLFGKEHDIDQIGMVVLGREMKSILERSSKLSEQILKILRFHISKKEESKLIQVFALEMNKELI